MARLAISVFRLVIRNYGRDLGSADVQVCQAKQHHADQAKQHHADHLKAAACWTPTAAAATYGFIRVMGDAAICLSLSRHLDELVRPMSI